MLSAGTMSGLLLLVTFTFAAIPSPTLGMTQFDIPQLRELTRQGNTSLEYIMGVVMMSLPQQLMARLQAKLQIRSPTGRGFGGSPGIAPGLPFPSGSFPFPLPSGQGGLDGSNSGKINSGNDHNNDAGSIADFNSDEPILLGVGRKKRSFGIFENTNVHSSPFHSAGAFGKSGFSDFGTFHQHGNTYGGFGHVSPSDQNGNLFGGTATGYINYPGSGHHYSSHNTFHGSHFGSGGFNKENCPRQADQGFVYQYDADPLTYPAIEIGNELFARSLPGSDLLFQTLSRQLVFPTDPPQIFIDEFLQTSNVTCSFKEDQVWSYQSQSVSGRCFPLVNFQELPLFRTCLNRFCKNCGGVGKSNYFWGYSATNSANICVTEYSTLSLWSYCEDLLPNQRIVRDRILVPNACTCTTVPCPSYAGYHK